MPSRIAIVEDEVELASLIDYNLTRGGFQTRVFPGSEGTIKELEAWRPDLIVLDVMLPGQDGFEICRKLRQTGPLSITPILFLTARSDEVDRVLGLEIGGDDYITKPFSPRELLARIKAHPALANMVLLRISRLSVQPVTPAEYDQIVALGQ